MSLFSMSQLDLVCSSLWSLYVPELNHCHSVAARKQFQKHSGRELKRLDGGWLCYDIAWCLIQQNAINVGVSRCTLPLWMPCVYATRNG